MDVVGQLLNSDLFRAGVQTDDLCVPVRDADSFRDAGQYSKTTGANTFISFTAPGFIYKTRLSTVFSVSFETNNIEASSSGVRPLLVQLSQDQVFSNPLIIEFTQCGLTIGRATEPITVAGNWRFFRLWTQGANQRFNFYVNWLGFT